MQWKIEGKARPPQRQWVPPRLTQGFSEEASKQGRPVGGGDLLEVQDDPIHSQLLSHPHEEIFYNICGSFLAGVMYFS